MAEGKIYGINGPVVSVRDVNEFKMMEMVKVGNDALIGEVIGITQDETTIQVYEPTAGIKPGEPVVGTGSQLSVMLAPGIIGSIFDGIQRPLNVIEKICGDGFIKRGVDVSALDTEKKWKTKIVVKKGDKVSGGSVIATVEETPAILHKVMVPPGVEGTVLAAVADGEYNITENLVRIEGEKGAFEIPMMQKWPIRNARPYLYRRPIEKLLVTGQRVIDTMFPIAKGGTAAIPGGFGTGKTMTQHQLAKYADADLIVYIGCGERGNEMTQVLEEFQGLIDPRTKRPLMDRTILIANTSNMPVAAREASIYTGITIAEYYRDMGYHVAIMADSTSRWAEALREISGRLEEMPAEEGFPAYLPSRLSEFYERAGYVKNLNGSEGSVSIIGAVSPQGADFSEPVTQNTKRFIRCFWALDKSLAYARHYPAINWTDSYSEYIGDLSPWYTENVGEDFMNCRNEVCAILAEEKNLMEIVKLIGADVLPDDQKLTIETARVIRVGFLQQNAGDDIDTYVVMPKQLKMMRIILLLHHMAKELIAKQVPLSKIIATGLFDRLLQMKNNIPNDKLDMFDEYEEEVRSGLSKLSA